MNQQRQNTPSETAFNDAMTLINGLELPYLIELAKHLEEHIEKRRKADIVDARLKIEMIARDVGLSVTDLLNVPASGVKGYLPPKYADPTDPKRTWSGHGRKPFWVRDLESQGIALDQLRITSADSQA
jgi:DNA-binding protein H-NS